MSIPGGDTATIAIARPEDPVRLTSKNTDLAGCRNPAMGDLPADHPRAAREPVPVARWIGPRQPLHARAAANGRGHAAADAIGGGCHMGAVATLTALQEPPCTRYVPQCDRVANASSGDPRATQENARILNLIDLELHAGREVVIAVGLTTGGALSGDRLLRITSRTYWPDGTIYYVGKDDAETGRDIRLYVHEDDLSLVSAD